MEVVNCKCPNCMAPLEFDAGSQKMTCEFCNASFDVEAVRQFDDSVRKAEEKTEPEWGKYEGDQWNEEGYCLHNCPSCGAQIVTEEVTAVTKCPYCDNVTVFAGNLSGVLRPDYVIPFKIDSKAAKEKLTKFCRGKFLLPKGFLQDVKLEETNGIYVPFWLFDCDAGGSVTYDATKVTSWSDSNYIYTKTSHYLVLREGTLSFERIPEDGSIKMDDAYMESIEPYDYAEMMDFDTAFLSGYVADKYNVDAQECKKRANERVKKSTEDTFASTVTGYSAVTPKATSIDMNNGKIKYALLPVWMLHYTHKGEKYTYAINGQTGKIAGKLPVSNARFFGYLAGIFAFVTAISALISGAV